MSYSTVVSNTCTCIYCDKCEMASSYVDECPECNGEGRFIDCYGDCYTDAVESAEAFIAEWVGDHNAEWFVVDGQHMGWTRASGTCDPIVGTDTNKGFKVLTLNGDWTITLTRDGDTLRAIRTSHDEPTGALFTYRKTEEDGSWSLSGN